MLEIVENELKKRLYKLQDREEPLAKAHALFHKGFKEVGVNDSKINVVYGRNQRSFFVGSAIAAQFTPEGEGLAGEGWNLKPDVIAAIWTDFSEAPFEAIVKSS